MLTVMATKRQGTRSSATPPKPLSDTSRRHEQMVEDEGDRPGTTDVEDGFTLLLRRMTRVPLLTKAEEVALAKRIERGDLAAKQHMVEANLRLVVHVARQHQGHGLDLPDLVQEGTLGLIRAVEKLDWRKGFK